MRSWEQDEGDASVPTPRIIHPRPYGYEAAPEAMSHHTYLESKHLPVHFILMRDG